ncbi:MAG: hypothetical protein ACI9G1_000624 [Pirellulaceae bacterium]
MIQRKNDPLIHSQKYFVGNLDKDPRVSDWLFLDTTQGNAKSHRDEDHADNVLFVTEGTEDALRDILDE